MKIFSNIEFTTKYDKEDYTFYHFHSSKINSIIYIGFLFDFISIFVGVSGGAVVSSYISILAFGEISVPESLVMFYGLSQTVFYMLLAIWLVYYIFRIKYIRGLKSETTSYIGPEEALDQKSKFVTSTIG